jgi:hypothetical protein
VQYCSTVPLILRRQAFEGEQAQRHLRRRSQEALNVFEVDAGQTGGYGMGRVLLGKWSDGNAAPPGHDDSARGADPLSTCWTPGSDDRPSAATATATVTVTTEAGGSESEIGLARLIHPPRPAHAVDGSTLNPHGCFAFGLLSRL